MMRHELEERIGRSLDEGEWDYLHMVYQYSPQIPDVGGKDELARLIGIPNGVYAIAKEAREIADAAGWKPARFTREEWWGWYDVCEGMVIEKRARSLADVCAYIVKGLDDYGRSHQLEGSDFKYYHLCDEYFSVSASREKDSLWPIGNQWIAVYAVTGGSEGHYIHIDAIRGQERETLLLGKTFQGMDHSLLIAGIVSKLLNV